MNPLIQSISQGFKGIVTAVRRYPASIGFALAFALVTMVRIHLDWPEQEDYNFLFNCLHWAFAAGAVFGLAALTAARSRSGTAQGLLLANGASAAVAATVLAALYFLGGTEPHALGMDLVTLSGISAARAGVVVLVSFLAFVLLAPLAKDPADFAPTFFMIHKALFIALIYGVVLMSGANGVAGAVQGLLYSGMSEKVYMYNATVAGFLAFTIFVGYFPDFGKGFEDDRREPLQRQPQFIEILFGFILVPVMAALTLVLLLWAGKTLVSGSWPPFARLSAIATAYAAGGIWLHLMLTGHTSLAARLYKRIYPLAALVILAFEAQALGMQVTRWGLKTAEYFFALIWIVAVASVVLLAVRGIRAHRVIFLLIAAASVCSVMPAVGYHAMPVQAQSHRLESLLISQGMLKDGILSPSAVDPDPAVREAVTDAVGFLGYARDAKLPHWFDTAMVEPEVFKERFGFAQDWPEPGTDTNGEQWLGLHLVHPAGALDIRGYEWAVLFSEEYKQDRTEARLTTDRGEYVVQWIPGTGGSTPRVKVLLNDIPVLEQDLTAHLEALKENHALAQPQQTTATREEMNLKLESQSLEVLVVFRTINIDIDPQNDTFSYWLDPMTVFLHEKE